MRGVAFRALAVALCVTAGAAVGSAAGPAGVAASLTVSELRSLVERASLDAGLDPRLMDALVRVESAYDPAAVSHKGAMGLMQLMPGTAARLRVDDPLDPTENVRGGVEEFRRLLQRYAGDLVLALAAYNAGEGAVARYRGVPPYPETRSYVRRILTMYYGRPYTLAEGGSVRRAVRLTSDPVSGQVVITNVRGAAAPGGSISIQPASGGGVLGGGFGSPGR